MGFQRWDRRELAAAEARRRGAEHIRQLVILGEPDTVVAWWRSVDLP
jgi:hypothetical protein